MRRVLLLNVTYEPLTTVGLRRAVCLVLGGKAEVVHDDAAGAVLHAATVALVTPSVIRLSRYVRVPYRNRVPLTRAALMRRDNYRCAYCGRRAGDHRPRDPAQPGRPARLGELRGVLHHLQPPKGRPAARGTRLDAGGAASGTTRRPLEARGRSSRRRPPVGRLFAGAQRSISTSRLTAVIPSGPLQAPATQSAAAAPASPPR